MRNKKYANDFNARFNDIKEHVVSLNDRILEQFSPFDRTIIDEMVNTFKSRNRSISNTNDFDLVETIAIPITKIQIDDTMQRRINIPHVGGIISGFIQSMVIPVLTYEDPKKPGHYIAIDGQHTLSALYEIAKGLNQDLNTCMVSIGIYKFSSRSEIRQNFIRLATIGDKKQKGSSKLPLYRCEAFLQKVRAVRVDHYNNDSDFNETEKKFTILENYGFFITHIDYGDADQDGAITRLHEINDFNPEILEYFCQYFNAVDQNRSVDSNELAIMMTFFNYCNEQNVVIDSKFINALAKASTDLFNADLNVKSLKGTFWGLCTSAYNNWHATSNRSGSPSITKNTNNGLTFFVAQISKTLNNYNIPTYTPTEFVVPMEDLV